MNAATRYLPFVGRLLIGLPFAMSGLSKLATVQRRK
jgi:putative oxidoreductase